MNTLKTAFTIAAVTILFVVLLVQRADYPVLARIVIGVVGVILVYAAAWLAYELWED